MTQHRIVCAALRLDGNIICGVRHFDDLMVTAINQYPLLDRLRWAGSEQGFVDAAGIFLTRKDAFVVATEAGQIIHRCGGDNGLLFSENLY